MNVFITGASGFIGKRLVAKLLRREGNRGFRPVARQFPEKIAALREAWGDARSARRRGRRATSLRPNLGVAAKDARRLKGKVDHFFHLAAGLRSRRRSG